MLVPMNVRIGPGANDVGEGAMEYWDILRPLSFGDSRS